MNTSAKSAGQKRGQKRGGGAKARSRARLGAVQALYQMDLAGTGLADIFSDFEAHHLGRDGEGNAVGDADSAFFRDLVSGVVREQRGIDPDINLHLAEGWQLTRIDATLRAILRAAAYELAFRADVPARVVLDEYVELAHAFFDGEEPKVVNGVLDSIARKWRADELAS